MPGFAVYFVRGQWYRCNMRIKECDRQAGSELNINGFVLNMPAVIGPNWTQLGNIILSDTINTRS